MLNLFDFSIVADDFLEIIKLLPYTLQITLISTVFGLLLAFVFAIIRINKIPVLKQIVSFIISIVRGLPVLVQLYITYYGIPIALKYINYYQHTDFEVAKIQPIVYALVSLIIMEGAFNSVVIQGALESVNKGEIEAAEALGMNGFQKMIRIILPEAIEYAIPSLGNNLIGLVKNTSLIFSVGVIEMQATAKLLGGRTYRYFEAFVALGIIYWIVTIFLEKIINFINSAVRIPDLPKSQRIINKSAGNVSEVKND